VDPRVADRIVRTYVLQIGRFVQFEGAPADLTRIDDMNWASPQKLVDAELRAGVSYARPAGVHHNVINVNSYEFRFVEIELK
jgi:hypothetical protein